MGLIFFISVIILQMLVYGFGNHVLFNEKEYNIGYSIFIFIICLGMYFLIYKDKSDMLYMHACAIVILCGLVKGSILRKIGVTIKAVFIITCCEEAIEASIALILQFLHLSMTSDKKFISAEIILLNIFLMAGGIKKSYIKVKRKYINALIMSAMGIMSIALIFVIGGIQYAKAYVNNNGFSILSDILTIISYLGIVILGLFIIYVKNENKNYKQLLETEVLLRNSQKIIMKLCL